MNRALAEAVVNELSVSGNNALGPGIWQSFDEKAWDRSLTWLDYSGLALYLKRRLESTQCLGTIPDRVRRRLELCEVANQMRASAMIEELKTLNEIFADAGVDHLVLKGITLVPEYCPHPAIRTQYDHDFLIRGEAVERAANALREAGYRRKNPPDEHPIVYYRPEPGVRFSADFVGLYSPLLGRSIELHLNLWGPAEDRIEISLPDDLFERAARLRWQDLEFKGLGDEDALMFQVLHAFRHVLRNWCRLSVFLEIANFISRQSSNSAFWKRFAARIENIHWAREATVVVFGLANVLYDAPIPDEIGAWFLSASQATLTLWIERYGRRSALANFRDNKYSLFLHREFVEDRSAWAVIRRQRLFPTNRPHRPPASVFRRGFSHWEKLRVDSLHALRRLKFHIAAVCGYVWQYPQWTQRRRARISMFAKLGKRFPPNARETAPTRLRGTE